MFYKNLLTNIYLRFSKFYVFLFGRKKMQFINDIIFSLSLDAKGYKHYGHLHFSGEKTFVRSIKKEIKLSIDIGANVGDYTKLLLKETDSKIISFEPLKDAFKDLEKIKDQYKDRLDIYNIALGAESKKQDIFFEHGKSEKASLISDLSQLSIIGDRNKNKTLIDVKKLDDFEKHFDDKKIDLIKIDTEGYEYEVLKGSEKILNKHKPKFIQIEFGWHHLIKNRSLYNMSQLINFSDVFRILPHGQNLIEINPARPENNIYHLSNYVFIRKDISNRFK